jgi:hypothetical protein
MTTLAVFDLRGAGSQIYILEKLVTHLRGIQEETHVSAMNASEILASKDEDRPWCIEIHGTSQDPEAEWAFTLWFMDVPEIDRLLGEFRVACKARLVQEGLWAPETEVEIA